jgi:hypothetical protein
MCRFNRGRVYEKSQQPAKYSQALMEATCESSHNQRNTANNRAINSMFCISQKKLWEAMGSANYNIERMRRNSKESKNSSADKKRQ